MQFTMHSFPKLAAILSLAGLLAGLGVSLLVAPRYVSSAEMQFTYASQGPPRQNLNARLVNMEQEILSRTSLSQIIQDPRLDLYKHERESTPLEDVTENMRTRKLRITTLAGGGDNPVFTIAFTYPDRIKARDTVQARITRFADANLVSQQTAAQAMRMRSADQISRLEQRIAALEKRLGIVSPPHQQLADELPPQSAGVNLEVLDPPSLPVNPVYPDRTIFAAFGFGGGFAMAVVVAAFRRRPPAIPFPAQTAWATRTHRPKVRRAR